MQAEQIGVAHVSSRDILGMRVVMREFMIVNDFFLLTKDKKNPTFFTASTYLELFWDFNNDITVRELDVFPVDEENSQECIIAKVQGGKNEMRICKLMSRKKGKIFF